MKHGIKRRLATIFICVWVAIACAEIKPVLEGTDWQLQQYQGDNKQMQRVLAEAGITARFNDGKVQGRAGCNQYFVAYSLAEERAIKLSQTGSTRMACSPVIAEQEQRYFTLLSTVNRYQLQNEQLVLFNTQQALLQYVRAQPMSLENVHWQATGINNGRGGVESNANTVLVSARFVDGKVIGSAACNQFSASYKVKGDQLFIGPAMTTRKYCGEQEGLMQLEQEFLQAIKKVSSYQLKNKTLELRSGEGSLQVLFKAKPGTPGP